MRAIDIHFASINAPIEDTYFEPVSKHPDGGLLAHLAGGWGELHLLWILVRHTRLQNKRDQEPGTWSTPVVLSKMASSCWAPLSRWSYWFFSMYRHDQTQEVPTIIPTRQVLSFSFSFHSSRPLPLGCSVLISFHLDMKTRFIFNMLDAPLKEVDNLCFSCNVLGRERGGQLRRRREARPHSTSICCIIVADT